jgi:uncharacterized protein YqgV (UPF0045/DUF77 family)
MSDYIEDLAQILSENNMQVTFSGWKHELEACEAKLKSAKQSLEILARAVMYVLVDIKFDAREDPITKKINEAIAAVKARGDWCLEEKP